MTVDVCRCEPGHPAHRPVCGNETDWPGRPCGLAPGHPTRCYPTRAIAFYDTRMQIEAAVRQRDALGVGYFAVGGSVV